MKNSDVFQLWHALNQRPQPPSIIGLAPSALLTLHSLITVANQAHWAHSFTCPDSTLSHLTHLSKQSITQAKRDLKNRGLIDYTGSPTTYEILLGNDLGRGLKKSLPSSPPHPLSTQSKEVNTNIKRTRAINKGDRNKGPGTSQSPPLPPAPSPSPLSKGGDNDVTSRHTPSDVRHADELTHRARESFGQGTSDK